jgi:quinoprotein glucose dehydrogenase
VVSGLQSIALTNWSELQYLRSSVIKALAIACFNLQFVLLHVGAATIPADIFDLGGTHFSPLAQITPGNIDYLQRAWVYHTGEKGRQFETTPVIAGGMMYLTSQNSRVIALEPESGKEIWAFDPHVKRTRENRGVSFWPGDGQRGARVFLGTGDGKLYALEAKTGHLAEEFGEHGVVDLRVGVADEFPKASYAITSPPAIYRNLVIVGPSTQESPSRGPSADPRAFDARSGKLIWRFHLVPHPGEPGNETWGPGGWRDRSGPSLWGNMSVDTERGLLFVPTGNPADSFYGADRKGTNLYANSVVALEADTGKLRWYFQMVHHDIFDFDVSGAPALITVKKDGIAIPAVAEITKMGLLFILDRNTGKPIFGVEERQVPASEVPGEEASPTQPFPLKPPPLARTSIDREDLSKRTPEAEKFCREQFDKYVHGSLYTPFGLKSTLVFPGAMGGGNWGGVAFDPALGYVFVNTTNMGNMGHMVPATPGSPSAYRNDSAYARFLDQEQYPCQRPPWGLLNAVSADSGDIVWQVPLGSYDDLGSDEYRHAGTPNVGGVIATAGGVVFIAATNDSRFRAFDSHTGKELWVARLEATGNATPATYMGRDGRQFVVIAAGGPAHLRNVGDTSQNSSDTIVAFALSSHKPSASQVNATALPPPVRTTAKSSRPVTVTASLPEGNGRAAVRRVCSHCHGVATFSGLRMERREWHAVISDMVQRGANGSPADIHAIEDYLSKYLGKN